MKNHKNKLSRIAWKIAKNIALLIETILLLVLVENSAMIIYLFLFAPLVTNILFDYIFPIIFYSLTGQSLEANKIKARMRKEINQIIDSFYNINLKIIGKFLFGAAIGVLLLMFNLTIAVRAANMVKNSSMVLRTARFKNFRDMQFFLTVIVAPLGEEVFFRGIVLNAIKFTCNAAIYCASAMMSLAKSMQNILFPKSQVEITQPAAPEDNDQPLNSYSKFSNLLLKAKNYLFGSNAISAVVETDINNGNQQSDPLAQEASKEDFNDIAISSISVVTSALVFSRAHSIPQQPYALVGGMVMGALHEYYDDEDDDLATSVGTHMSNNFICAKLMGY